MNARLVARKITPFRALPYARWGLCCHCATRAYVRGRVRGALVCEACWEHHGAPGRRQPTEGRQQCLPL